MALQQLQRSRGNALKLGTFQTGSLAGPVTGILKADMREYVPVAMLLEETTLVVGALKHDPTSVKIAVALAPQIRMLLDNSQPHSSTVMSEGSPKPGARRNGRHGTFRWVV